MKNKEKIYYCEQGDKNCLYPKCVCNTVREKKFEKCILCEFIACENHSECFKKKYKL